MSIEEKAHKIMLSSNYGKLPETSLDRRVLITDSLTRLMKGQINMPRTQFILFSAAVYELLDAAEGKSKTVHGEECCGMTKSGCRFACRLGH